MLQTFRLDVLLGLGKQHDKLVIRRYRCNDLAAVCYVCVCVCVWWRKAREVELSVCLLFECLNDCFLCGFFFWIHLDESWPLECTLLSWSHRRWTLTLLQRRSRRQQRGCEHARAYRPSGMWRRPLQIEKRCVSFNWVKKTINDKMKAIITETAL